MIDSFENPMWFTLASAGVVVPAAQYALHRARHVQEVARDHGSPEDVRHLYDTAPNRRSTKSLALQYGVGLLAASAAGIWLAEPVETQAIPNPNAQIEVVMDHSRTMTLTNDIDGMSRYDAVTQAVNNSLEKTGSNLRVGLIDFGADVKAHAPTNNKTSLNNELATPASNSNGGDVVDAIDQAVGSLPGNGGNRLVIISDGTVDTFGKSDDKTSITDAINTAKAKKIDVDVIVPGHHGTTYKIDSFSNPVSSSIEPDVYSAAGAVQIETTTEGITEQLEQSLKYSSTHTEKRRWKPSNWIAAGSLALMGLVYYWEPTKRQAIINDYKHRKK